MGLFGSLRGPNAQVAFGTISRQSCSLSLVHKNIYKRKCTPGTNTNPIPFPGDTDMTSSFRTASPEKQTSYLTAYFHIFYSSEIFTTVYKQFRKNFQIRFYSLHNYYPSNTYFPKHSHNPYSRSLITAQLTLTYDFFS
jgi:hypothetical protein